MSDPQPGPQWHDLGPVEQYMAPPLRQIRVGRTAIALTYREGAFSAISGVCNHVGGPLGEGRLDGEYVVCPWHSYKFHCRTGVGEPGFEQDQVPAYDTRIEEGRLFIDMTPRSGRRKMPHAPHPLTRSTERAPGPVRVVGLSTTNMDMQNPRYSGSDDLLEAALAHAGEQGAQTRLVRLAALRYRACEGYYSKSARACTWPCTITQMDPSDEMEQVYEALVHWGDVVLVGTPIRWGSASSLYYRMVERMNCVQNQVTIGDRVLIRNKVAAFVIIGGQDNVQAVAGQMLGFFGEIGYLFPQFPYIAHSRGWSSEDMERNVSMLRRSPVLRQGARDLVDRCLALSRQLLEGGEGTPGQIGRGGRKAQRLEAKGEGPE